MEDLDMKSGKEMVWTEREEIKGNSKLPHAKAGETFMPSLVTIHQVVQAFDDRRHTNEQTDKIKP